MHIFLYFYSQYWIFYKNFKWKVSQTHHWYIDSSISIHVGTLNREHKILKICDSHNQLLLIGYQGIILDLEKMVLDQLIGGATWSLEVAYGADLLMGQLVVLGHSTLTLKGPKWPLRPRVFDNIFKYLPMKLECSQFCIQSSFVAWIMENVVMPCLK
jgi:hypothetical protein